MNPGTRDDIARFDGGDQFLVGFLSFLLRANEQKIKITKTKISGMIDMRKDG